MGSRIDYEHYFQDHPGVYYRSTGWVERGADLEPLARTQTGMGYTLDALSNVMAKITAGSSTTS